MYESEHYVIEPDPPATYESLGLVAWDAEGDE